MKKNHLTQPDATSPPAVVHIDLDGAEAIYRVHGWPYPYDEDPLFETGLSNLLQLLDMMDIKATLFTIAADVEQPRKRALLETAVAQGHEIACHSYSHRKLTTLTAAEQACEVINSREQLIAALDVPVRGFRAPYFDIDGEAIKLMTRAGYLYDSSFFPGSNLTLDEDIIPIEGKPFRWFSQGLFELPLPAYAPLPFPWHASYSLVFGLWYFRLGLRRFRRTQAPLVLLFHLTDFADPMPSSMTPDWRSRFFTLSYQSGARKRQLCTQMLNIVRREYRLVDTLNLLATVS